MTQEEMCTRLEAELDARLDGVLDSETEDSAVIKDRTSVKDMILKFERSALSTYESDSSDSLARHKDPALGSLLSVVNPVHVHFPYLGINNKSQDRNSSVSVNSILSNASKMSYESSSSGFVSDRKSGTDSLVPRRPAPPPPEPFNDSSSCASKSPGPDEIAPLSPDRRYSFTTPNNSSPVVLRRARQPPVIRRKSLAGGNQGHTGETLWSYGVKQNDLEKLLRLKCTVISDSEETTKDVPSVNISETDSSGSDSSDSENSEQGEEYVANDDARIETISTDRSTDTLINDNGNSEDGDNSSVVSDVSSERSNYDNVSIKSISSFDMVPYQKYDSITVSSDEFGAEVCHAPDTEFLTVSAVNEWCRRISNNSVEQELLPVETKKEKYRRRMTERVKELIHTETVYVDRLRHVVEDYISELMQDDVPPSLRVLKPDIFANIERIYRFHKEELLPAFKDCENDLRKLGQCFRNFEQKFNMYVMYSRSNKRATRLVFEHKQFFLEKQHQLGDRLDLSSYLLEPVQRIPRYKLFLDDLVKTYNNYENEKSESDSRISKLSADSDETGGSNGESSEDETPLESLKQAKSKIECVLTAMDGIMALENIRDCPPHINLLNQGRLLRQNEFYAMDTAKRRRQLMRIFLFDKLLLLTVVYRKQLTVELFLYKDHIPVDDLGITAKEQDQYKFTIWYKKRNIKSYKLETRDPVVRNSWVEEISSLLWVQAMQKKELLLQQRSKRISMISTNSEDCDSIDGERNDDKYNSLRGVPGEVRRSVDNTVRRTTWYCE